MRVVALAVLVLLFVGAGTAFANPVFSDWLCMDFDPPNLVHEVYPAIFETVDAYVMLAHPELLLDGFTAVSFALSVTPGMADSPTFTPLLPGAIAVGTWDTGITIASTECVTTFPAQIGRLSFVYQGVPGDITILNHPDFPNWVIDCQQPGQVVYSCEFWHGGVGKPGVIGERGYVPVEDVTWGAIKSLYR